MTFKRGKVIFNLGDNTHKRLELLELLLSQLKTQCFTRDDLELLHKGVQTDIHSDFGFTNVKDVNNTQEKFTQTDDGECFQFENLVTSLACNAVKESLFELLNEELNMM